MKGSSIFAWSFFFLHKNTWGNGKLEKLILEKLEQSESGRERFVTTDLNVLKAVRTLGNQGLVQWKVKMQPAQPLGLIVHDDQLNTVSDWAEKMVCQIIGAEQTAWNCKGYDGVLADGTKVEIKLSTMSYKNTYKRKDGTTGHTKRNQVQNLDKNPKFDFLIIAAYLEKPKCYKLHNADFFIIPKEEVKHLMYRNSIEFVHESSVHKKMKKYECTLAELAELNHGYDHFLKMKGKVPPIEPPKERIQFVVDVWKPNRLNLMPYDKRYEDSSWYAEFAVAQLLGGTVTEQRCAGYDVDVDGFKIQVKMANLSNEPHNQKRFVWSGFSSKDDYDLFVGVYLKVEDESSFVVIPKMLVEQFKDKSNNLKLTPKEKTPTFKRLKPFMFTIDHLVELGQIGYEQFYLKYLKEPCEKVLGVEIKNGSDDVNGNQIDLKPKFPIQFKSSKRTNQADQRSA